MKFTNMETRLMGSAAVLMAGGSLFAGLPMAASAQDATSDESTDVFVFEEIVVTATRRQEKITDVPISIQAISGADLRRSGAVNFADYARTVAGVAFQDDGPGRAQIFIRGVSTGGDVGATGKESTVGVYFDEVPVTEGSSQPDLKLYDVSRVEVLRGPQGTLYGSGSVGGTVRIITNRPEFDAFSGNVSAEGSTTREGGENGAINGWVNLPVSDKVAVRAVGYGIHNSGFLDNGFSGEEDINEEDTWGGRLALRLKPSEKFDATLTGYYQNSTIDAFTRASDDFPNLVQNRSAPEPFEDKFGILNLTFEWDLDFATLTSSTSYFDRSRDIENDIDYFLEAVFGIPRGTSILGYEVATIVEEVRLASSADGPLRWLVGGFYLDRDDDFLQTINFLGVEPAATPAANLYYSTTTSDLEQIAGFGEISYDLTDRLEATVGLRVSRTKREAEIVTDGFALGFSTATGEFSNTATTPKFNLSYKLGEDSLLFAQAAKGFRIGGVNPGLPPCSAACVVDVNDTFGPDSLWNYEVGLKTQTPDGKLSVTASAFWIDWSDIQLSVSRGDGFDGFLNAGTARSKGFELELSGYTSEHFRFGGQLTYTDATLRSLSEGLVGFAEVGVRLPDVPEWSGSVNAEVGTYVFDDGWFYLRGDAQFVGDRNSQLGAGSLPVNSYALVNLQVGLDFEAFSVAVFANNLTDKRAELDRTNFAGVRDGTPIVFDRYTINVPRTIGVRLSKNF